MAKTHISPEMSVREVNLKHPACRAVFNKYGMGGCGGQLGPAEPLDFFASAHNVPLEQLLRELNEAAERDERAAVAEEVPEPNELFRPFIKAALLFTLTLGTAWGVSILTKIALHHSFEAPPYAQTQAHGHAQTFGWEGLFIIGVAYYTIPKFKNAPLRHVRLAAGTFWMLLAGILLRSLAQPLGGRTVFGLLAIGGSLIELAAIGVFAALLVDVFRRSPEKPEFYEMYLHAGMVWFGVVGVLNVLGSLAAFRTGSPVIPPFYNDPILHLQAAGFITTIILGVSIRILPHFLGLQPPLERPIVASFYLYNAGLALRALKVQPMVLSSGLELLGILLFVWGIRIFARPAVKVSIEGVDDAFGWFIKLGYGWLVMAGAMLAGADIYRTATGVSIPHAYIGAYRHAITVGFISTLMMGVAYRILPIFSGTELRSVRAMRASFVLIAVGNLFRVGFQLGTLTGSPVAFALMGTSGYLELAALALFSWNIWRTMDAKEDLFLQDHVIRPSTRVADVLNLYPELRMVLIQSGFTHLATLPRVPGFVTLDFAARRHGLDPQAIADKLNDFVGKTRKEKVG